MGCCGGRTSAVTPGPLSVEAGQQNVFGCDKENTTHGLAVPLGANTMAPEVTESAYSVVVEESGERAELAQEIGNEHSVLDESKEAALQSVHASTVHAMGTLETVELPNVAADGVRVWSTEALCDGFPAKERAAWLVQSGRCNEEEARSRVMIEFPHAFKTILEGRQWLPEVMCDGTLAKDRAAWLVSNGVCSAWDAAQVQVMHEFSDLFYAASPVHAAKSGDSSAARIVIGLLQKDTMPFIPNVLGDVLDKCCAGSSVSPS
eukprot:TRINITY_DN42292_c0_g1_i1.p1 TRINITY_DN42292_c0_g1~~TRINITY_DN42292_c0_g1_i1.p1  ORF type:complete len:262 (+),score=53.02 TRINITY_DN42292_c0_g1_i1:99-884(+)